MINQHQRWWSKASAAMMAGWWDDRWRRFCQPLANKCMCEGNNPLSAHSYVERCDWPDYCWIRLLNNALHLIIVEHGLWDCGDDRWWQRSWPTMCPHHMAIGGVHARQIIRRASIRSWTMRHARFLPMLPDWAFASSACMKQIIRWAGIRFLNDALHQSIAELSVPLRVLVSPCFEACQHSASLPSKTRTLHDVLYRIIRWMHCRDDLCKANNPSSKHSFVNDALCQISANVARLSFCIKRMH